MICRSLRVSNAERQFVTDRLPPRSCWQAGRTYPGTTYLLHITCEYVASSPSRPESIWPSEWEILYLRMNGLIPRLGVVMARHGRIFGQSGQL